ncbi:MAG: hypothetical protein AAF582_00090 [Pseudomonadota bacterium]
MFVLVIFTMFFSDEGVHVVSHRFQIMPSLDQCHENGARLIADMMAEGEPNTKAMLFRCEAIGRAGERDT